VIAAVDTSAVIRLFVPDGALPDGFERFMQEVETGTHIALAPELMLVEVANVLHKKRAREELSTAEAEALLGLIRHLPIRLVPHGSLLQGAMQLAMRFGLSVYDAVFLELTRQKGDRLFTAYQQLATAAGQL
jgi:predicted nucleic acid-binding protein